MAWRDIVLRYSNIGLRLLPVLVADLAFNKRVQKNIVEFFLEDSAGTWAAYIGLISLALNCLQVCFVVFMLRLQSLLELHLILLQAICAALLHTAISSPQYLPQFGGLLPMVLPPLLGVMLVNVRHLLTVPIFSSRPFFTFLQRLTMILYSLPVYLELLGVSKYYVQLSALFPVAFTSTEVILITGYKLYYLPGEVQRGYEQLKYMKQNFGLEAVFESEWNRLQPQKVLSTFYFLKVFYSVFLHTSFPLRTLAPQWLDALNSSNASSTLHSTSIFGAIRFVDRIPEVAPLTTYLTIFDYVNLRTTETIVSVISMTPVISMLARTIGYLLLRFLGTAHGEERDIGLTAGMLFIILTLQTGLASLGDQTRLLRLYKNFWLLGSAVLHNIHALVSILLLQIPAETPSLVPRKQARILVMCLILLLIPPVLLLYLWKTYEFGTWLLAVTVFFVELQLKVVFSLLQWVVYVFDACWTAAGRSELFNAEDTLFVIRAIGAFIEFVCGFFLFLNGVYMMIYEGGGMIRAVLVLIHAYLNIFQQAVKGFETLKLRRNALQRLRQLSLATSQQLEEYNDVCSICYDQMKIARVSDCGHFFHEQCLRRWLYVQNTCPMCHKTVLPLTRTVGIQHPPAQRNVPVLDRNDAPDMQVAMDINANARAVQVVLDRMVVTSDEASNNSDHQSSDDLALSSNKPDIVFIPRISQISDFSSDEAIAGSDNDGNYYQEARRKAVRERRKRRRLVAEMYQNNDSGSESEVRSERRRRLPLLQARKPSLGSDPSRNTWLRPATLLDDSDLDSTDE